MLVNHSSFG